MATSNTYRPNFVATPPTSYYTSNFSASPPSSYYDSLYGINSQFANNLYNTPSVSANRFISPRDFAQGSSGSGFDLSSLLGPASGLLGGLSSGIFGYFSQREANKAMLEATRMNNEHNYKIWQEQQNHNKEMFQMENRANIDMWNRNNEYNSPTAQVERLRKAGLNAGIMLNGGNASGVSSSPASGAHAQPAQAPTMQAPPAEAFQNPTLVGLQNGMQALLGMSSALNQSQQLGMSQSILPYTLKGLEHDLKGKHLLNKTANFDLKSKEAFFETQYLQQQMILDNMRAQNAVTRLDIKQRELFLQYYPAQLLDEMALRAAQLVAYADSHDMSQKQLEEIISKIAKTYSDIAVNNSTIATNNQLMEESESRESVNYATVGKLRADTAQVWQNIGQSSELFPHVKQGYINSNLNTMWSANNGQIQYRIARDTFKGLVNGINAENSYKQSYFGVEKTIYDDIQKNIGDGTGFNLFRSAGGLGRYVGNNFPINLGFSKQF